MTDDELLTPEQIREWARRVWNAMTPREAVACSAGLVRVGLGRKEGRVSETCAIPRTQEEHVTPEHIIQQATEPLAALADLTLEQRVEAINAIREVLHQFSPFATEPVDFVRWVPTGDVRANDYNPNSVAPPEMKLLAISIGEDGYTQPIVAWHDGDGYEVVDGFHRNRVAREIPEIGERVHGYLPLAVINDGRIDLGDRMAATIRHNRARGKHRVDAMSEIVIELKRRNWSDAKIGRELGMDPDEVLRLTQITGLAEMFADRDFSEAWEASLGEIDPSDIGPDDLFGVDAE